MRFRFAACWHYRPRVLTFIVLVVVAVTIVLANLSEDVRARSVPFTGDSLTNLKFDVSGPVDHRLTFGTWNISYGWPLLWRQYVVAIGYGGQVVAELSSKSRLAGNVAMWLVMLAAPAAACEWLLRRYRLRLRWSLRTMLAVVGLIAAFCAWYVVARDRANVEDPLITAIEARHGSVWLERWGPEWLDVVGADRLRRRIIGAQLGNVDKKVEDLLERLARRDNLQYLILNVRCLNPRMAAALADMRQLRTFHLTVDDPTPEIGSRLSDALAQKPRLRTLSLCNLNPWNNGNDQRMSHEILAAVANATRLESLYLSDMAIDGEDLACLGALPNLKFLNLADISIAADFDRSDLGAPLLSRLPTLSRLEELDLYRSEVGDGDLRHLNALSRLRSLSLIEAAVTNVGLAELASLESLEELTIGGDNVTAADLESLRTVSHLNTLHIGWFKGKCSPGTSLRPDQLASLPDEEFDDWLRALEALRHAKPSLVIDGGDDTPPLTARMIGQRAESLIPPQYELPNRGPFRGWLKLWMEQKAKRQTGGGLP